MYGIALITVVLLVWSRWGMNDGCCGRSEVRTKRAEGRKQRTSRRIGVSGCGKRRKEKCLCCCGCCSSGGTDTRERGRANDFASPVPKFNLGAAAAGIPAKPELSSEPLGQPSASGSTSTRASQPTTVSPTSHKRTKDGSNLYQHYSLLFYGNNKDPPVRRRTPDWRQQWIIYPLMFGF